ncbi:MAG: ATP-binding cassette domain-containing protein [Planctomycetes bacterium]|nr:ATP-binding cassette domain-containing protein [Planctomycetota bacterium]
MFGLLGPNGAGKSTFMNLVAGLVEPTAGRILLDGVDVVADPRHMRERLGYLPQDFGFYPDQTGRAMLEFLLKLTGVTGPKGRRALADGLLERVNLTSAAKRKVGGYSGGMRQRSGLAQAIAGDPRVLIVDEPTAGLDPEERQRFYRLLSELSAGRVVLLSTYIVDDVATLCPRLAVLRAGEVVADTSPTAARRAVADADVLLLGEEHHVQAHHDFVVVLLPRLHERGFRSVLCEANHAYVWLLDEYVKGARDTLAEKQWNLGRDWIEAIRALNAGLRAGGRAGEQISVGCCDVNHWDDSYRESLAALAERYRSQPLAELVAQLPAPSDTAYVPAVAAIVDAAAGDPARLGLDAAGMSVVTATTRVELASARYRTSRSDAAREDVLHQNVTAATDRLAPGGKLAVVCGMSHAQLRPAWRMPSGRAWEWLGTRLAARYAATLGRLYSLACFAARGQHKPNFRSRERFDVDVQ